MRLETAFRFSFYATLAVACLSLGIAELFFLPWMIVLSVAALAFIVLAYRNEGRWALSEDMANILGLGIGSASLGWIYLQLPRSEEDLLARGVPWPAGLLPHVGPLLLGLVLVKLFRPKREADFWSIQVIGLMMITLGCVLTGDFIFGVLLIIYFACVLWCLGLFYAFRQQRACDAQAANAVSFLSGRDSSGKLNWPVLGLGSALQRAVVLLPVAFVLFLIAPRRTDSEWVPYKLSTTRDIAMRAGVPTDIDLNRVGKVQLSENPVFKVNVANSKGEPVSLPGWQRFRASALDYYRNGRWHRLYRGFGSDNRHGLQMQLRTPAQIPDLGAEQILLTFAVNPEKAGDFVLAEPIVLTDTPGQFPYERLDGSPSRSLFYELAGTGTLMPFPNPSRHIYHYKQTTLPADEHCLMLARHVSGEYIDYLRSQQVPPEIVDYTHRLLGALPFLSPEERKLTGVGETLPQHQMKVALALERHLASSGEFSYSLNLHRHDAALDPTVDFLVNIKQGHCERFAAALALMLRSVGIPSRLVSGFHGAEALAEGAYEVREKNAHSWVEALVPFGADTSKLYWVSLDGTPADEAANLDFGEWLLQNWHNGHLLWRNLILEYDTTRQRQALVALAESLQQPATWIYVGVWTISILGGALGLFLLRGYWARQKKLHALAEGSLVPFYERFLEIVIHRFQLEPDSAQTPREFAQVACAKLAEVPAAASLKDIPQRLVALLYRIRYGRQQLTADEAAQVKQMLADLDSALKTTP